MTLLIGVSAVGLAVRANTAKPVALAEADRAMWTEESVAEAGSRAQQSRQLAEAEALQATAAEGQIQELEADTFGSVTP